MTEAFAAGPAGAALAIAGMAGAIGAGLIFIVGAFVKFRHRRTFAGVVANYRLLPRPAVAPVAAVLPWAELAVGIALLTGIRAAALPAAGLLGAFAGAVAINLLRGRAAIDCGCGLGSLSHPLRAGIVGRNLALAGLVALRLAPVREPSTATIVAAVAPGVTLALLVWLADEMAALPSFPRAVARGR